MPFSRDVDRLDYILELIDLIHSEIEGYSRDEFLKTRSVRDLATYRLGTVGETAHRLSENLKSQQEGVPWRAIAAFRNIVVHDYLSINSAYVWNIIERDLMEFERACRMLRDGLEAA
jgi:uncharacterized protein with HEPN domain